MMPSGDSNFEILKTLSISLGQNIRVAEYEVKQSKEQLDALLYSKGLVDDSISKIGGTGSYLQPAQMTIGPTGSMVLPISQQFNQTAPGSGRSFICDQIQTSISAAVSAFITAVPAAQQGDLAPLRNKLETHNEELLSLEARLSSRIGAYSGHLQKILEGALNSYRDAGNPLRYVNTGNGLRELFREFLGEVAPDDEVKKAPWFVPDKTSKNGVTRRHRIDYAVFGNLVPGNFPKTFADQADGLAENLPKDIGELSAFTHVTAKILAKNYDKSAPLFAAVMQRFILLVSAIESAKMFIEKDVAYEIQKHLDDVFTGDFFDELDCLSSHTRPQGASDVELSEVTFDEEWIEFTGSGSVDCDLQWGSDGDVRRGDGAESSKSFPFTFSGKAPIGDLTRIEVDRSSISINTSSFGGPDDYDASGETGA